MTAHRVFLCFSHVAVLYSCLYGQAGAPWTLVMLVLHACWQSHILHLLSKPKFGTITLEKFTCVHRLAFRIAL